MIRKFILFSPLLLLILISAILFFFLIKDKDPNKPPSALLNKEIPEFEIVSLFDNNKYFSKENLKNKQVLINFFASWCIPCKAEHPLLMKIKNNNKDLIIVGIDFKDKKEEAIKFLEENGNPYHYVGFDDSGSVGLEFGVFGLPETFITNKDGKIIYKHIGPITKKILSNEIAPLFN